MRPLVAVIVLVSASPAAPVPKSLKKADDATLIVGTWQPVKGQDGWMEFSADGGVKAWNTGETAATGLAYTWAIDPTASPKRLTFSSPATKAPIWQGVYEVDGSAFRITYVPAGWDLPTEVGPVRGTNFCNLRRHDTAK